MCNASAYNPAVASTKKKNGKTEVMAHTMWQTQNILHKYPQVVPGVLWTTLCSLIAWHYLTRDLHIADIDVIGQFLTMCFVQTIPLIILEVKLMSCKDPVGLFCKFAVPVTVTHAFFLSMRLAMYDSYEQRTLVISAVSLVFAMLTIVKGFCSSWMDVIEHRTVWSIITMAFMAAVVSTSMDAMHQVSNSQPGGNLDWTSVASHLLLTANSYVELVAFLPAVLMTYNESRYGGYQYNAKVEGTDTTRTCTAFFLFLVSFYVLEDLPNAYYVYDVVPLAAVAYIGHFLLVLDFACYVLAHIYNPDKLMGELSKWIPIHLSYDV